MAPEDSEEEGFKVTDRRRRSDQEAPTPEPPRTIEVPRSEPARAEPSRAEAPRSTPPPRAAEGSRSEPEGERNLAGLFVMLASSAAMALGEVPDPMTGQVHRDLAQAAELIDLLALLREKTEGNLTPEEAQILEELVYDLQLRYVAATKRSGSPPGPSRS